MTGQGQGQAQCGSALVAAEVRAVNNRHLKIQARLGEGLAVLEPKVETLVKQHLRRGSLQISVQLTGAEVANEYRLEESVIKAYAEQCGALRAELGMPEISWAALLALPGVVSEQKKTSGVDDELQAAVLSAVEQSLGGLNEMRQAEGSSMASELVRQLQCLDELTDEIDKKAPHVVEDYRERLRAKVSSALNDVGASLEEGDLIREVLLLADKSDIREEIVRLRSHSGQFGSLLKSDASQGRKLDFLIQEMFRETNTIGSKASDAEIAQRVVDMKSILEQMRELVQNVE